MISTAAHQECLYAAINIQNDHSPSAFDDAKRKIKEIAAKADIEPKSIYSEFIDACHTYRTQPHRIAIDAFSQLIKNCLSQNEAVLENVVYVNLGRLFGDLGEYQVALQYLMKAQRNEHLFEPSYLMVLKIFLSDIYLKLGDNTHAIECGQQVITSENTLSRPLAMAINHHNIALAQTKLGEFDSALEHLNSATTLAIEIESDYVKGYNSLARAQWHVAQQQHEHAERYFRSAMSEMGKTSVIHTINEVYFEYGEYLVSQARYEDALVRLEYVEGHSHTQENLHLKMHLHQLLYTCYRETGLNEAAFNQVEIQRSLFDELRKKESEEKAFLVSEQLVLTEREQKQHNYLQMKEYMSAISGIGQMIATCDDIAWVLPNILEGVKRILPCEYFSLTMLDEENDMMHNDYQVKMDGVLPPLSYCYSDMSSIAAYCCSTRKSVLLNTGTPSEIYYYLPHLASENITYIPGTETMTFSGIFTPIILGDEVLGCMSLQHSKTYRYEQHHLDIMDQLGQFIAVAINNITQRRQLEKMSKTDGLTGLLNRRTFDEVAGQYIAQKDQSLSMIMIDIDYFKQYNDTLGHSSGDKLLGHLSALLHNTFDASGDVFRYGGDEFFILLQGDEVQSAYQKAQTLVCALEEADLCHPASKVGDRVTLSIGVASCVGHPDLTVKDVIQMADKALYQAKEQGRNKVCCLESSSRMEAEVGF
ncbi:diguanylate cyclase [Vibrio sp. RE86]|uniref:sensor domain-containing diguanylate cyclase n=1 Tax=Vibrio sp. RE86 TaxID=2607605 RepID=UPI0014932BBA|nr:diguanylate cyclase [Vibrio sp. RE86]NOH78723.1 diguanylate cyclase [Vibrio sp. RE86]